MKNFARAFLFIASIALLLIARCNNQDITPPAAIDANSINVTVGDGSVQLSWTDSSDNDFYGTRISFTPAAANVTQPITIQGDRGSVSSTTISGLSNNTEYTFSLVALDKSLNVSLATIKRATPTASNNSSSSTEETSTSGGSTTGETTGSGGSTGGDSGSGGSSGSGSGSTTTPTGYPATVVASYTYNTSQGTVSLVFYSNNTFIMKELEYIGGFGTYTGNATSNGQVIATQTQGATSSGSFNPSSSIYIYTVSGNGTTLTGPGPVGGTVTYTRDNISTTTPTVVATYSKTMASQGYPQLVDKYVFYSNGTWIERYDGTGPEYGSNGPVQGSSISYDLVGRAGVYTGNAATNGSVTLITILTADEPSSTATSYTNTNCPLQAYTDSGAQFTASIAANGSSLTLGSGSSGMTYTRVTN